MQDFYNYTLEKSHISRVNIVATVLYLRIIYAARNVTCHVKYVFYFYINAFCRMRAVPNMAFFFFWFSWCRAFQVRFSGIFWVISRLFHLPLLSLVSLLLHYLLTPWCRVLLEKLTGLLLVKKFPAFYGTRKFITTFTNVRHLSLSWASPIQSTYPHPSSWKSILILSTHLRLGLSSGLFPSGFPTKTLYTPSPRPYTIVTLLLLLLLLISTKHGFV